MKIQYGFNLTGTSFRSRIASATVERKAGQRYRLRWDDNRRKRELNVSTLDETSNEVLAEMTWFPRNRSWDGRAVGVFRVAHDGGSRGRPDGVVNDAPENGRP